MMARLPTSSIAKRTPDSQYKAKARQHLCQRASGETDQTALALAVTAATFLVERLDRERLGCDGRANNASKESQGNKRRN
jgi:hypothetical protein